MFDKESILVIGGARSGKSTYALKWAEEKNGNLIFLATAEGRDSEMNKRIANHKLQRDEKQWITIEEPLEIVEKLQAIRDVSAVVLDCITMWVSNALLADKQSWLQDQVVLLKKEIPHMPFHFLAVSNEVGLGLVPESSLGREYRDLLGKVNQELAEVCNRVIFKIAGISLQIKG